ncbi:zinc finger and BTB domain-containing protein 24-like [Dendronephthya gigantea]|uniref:zinc finger and BTB domain-containing protein 24-like n=1 Tax=Dendronephthya gigantea TaxID=151771 RepID=UPI001068F608|nr:zinc finger and BTB domain-containing protein 24-like [Dendronephthya gigantea]XP_028396411.1 zinc finger and BTB domain-containing protein 24-like [Dendronephthya gigantea]XP_028396412.1 zinc finger and BTB domain-containing protein 24-like [Dendronephthya gigantea]
MPKAGELDEGDELRAAKPKPKSNRKGKGTNSNGHDCHICRKSNMTLSGLKIHLLTHTGEKPYLCTVCDKRFTCSSNLKKHQRIHNKDYIYECEVCGKTCSDPSNMKKHMTVHSGEKAYVCPSCGKSYSYAQSLRQHMDDVHVGNGEKRPKNKRKGHFPCPECGKVFGYYWRCSLHQARVHAVDRPYKCPECGKSFARETILNKHLQTHEKPYSCAECDRKFSFRDQLQKHKRTHSGERPYQCETCLRSFSQRGSLNEHKRTHTGVKPYVCQICGVKFSSSSSLRRHERKVKSCFPAPEGEEIPMRSLYPRRPIYVPTPPISIARVETAPVNESHGLKWVQKPYTPTSTMHNGISTADSFSTENGLTRSGSTTELGDVHHAAGEIYDGNGNLDATMVPTSQISMVVKCDKNGMISVVPVTLQAVNGIAQLAPSNGTPNDSEHCEPVALATSNQPCSSAQIRRPTFAEPSNNFAVASTNHQLYPTSHSVATETANFDPSRLTSVASDATVAMETMHNSQHGDPNEPNFGSEADNVEADIPPEYPSMSTISMKPRFIENGEYSQDEMRNGHETSSNPTLADAHHRVMTKHSPSPNDHQSTNIYGTSAETSPNPNVTPVLSPPQHQLLTKHKPPTSMTSITLNGQYSNHHPPITTSLMCEPLSADINNNMMRENANNHMPVRCLTIMHSPERTAPLQPTSGSCMHGDGMEHNVPRTVSSTNEYHAQSPPHILLPSTMIKSQLTDMEPKDIKPILGVDVPVYK